MTDLKSSGASAAMNVHCDEGRLFRTAFSRADWMEAIEMSMPVD